MKVTIVIDGEEMFSGNASEWLVLMPKNGNLEIALTTERKPKKKLRSPNQLDKISAVS